MYDARGRAAALENLARGDSLSSVSRATGINRSTFHAWLATGGAFVRAVDCPICIGQPPGPDPYTYLLGMYLGDGCISEAPRTTALRISCADAYPMIMAECDAAIRGVSTRKVYRVQNQGCTMLTAVWKHWPCLFPQHGRGVKHRRPIILAKWQRDLVAAAPDALVKGLIHFDGCRATNTVHRSLPAGVRTYTYPRYFFTNESADIREIFTDALDLLGIAWKQNRHNSISVARREAVAALDEFIGPKR